MSAPRNKVCVSSGNEEQNCATSNVHNYVVEYLHRLEKIRYEILLFFAGPKNPFLRPDGRVATGEGRLAQ